MNNPLLVLIGIPLMAGWCWFLSKWFPLLEGESHAHGDSLPLDGLRGLLASAVFFHHSYITCVYFKTGVWRDPPSIFYGQLGPTAVTLFFFISGYLFWRKMLADPASLEPRPLWSNRFRRIMPAYWTSVCASFIAIAVLTKFHLHQPPLEIVSRATLWLLVGLPCLPSINGVAQQRVTAGVYWTLRVEVLFYLLLPGLRWFRRKWRPLILLLLALGVYLVLKRFSAPTKLLECSADSLTRFISALLKGFSIGALAAYEPWGETGKRWLRSRWAALLGVLLLGIHLTYVRATYSWKESLALAPFFFVVVSGNRFAGILDSRPMRCLGQVSYSIYIFHGLILFTLTSMLNVRYPIAPMPIVFYWSNIVLISLGVVSISTLTYWFVERPFFSIKSTSASRHAIGRGWKRMDE